MVTVWPFKPKFGRSFESEYRKRPVRYTDWPLLATTLFLFLYITSLDLFLMDLGQ